MIARRRRKILAIAAVLIVTAIALPVLLVSNLSQKRAIDAELRHLTEYARWTLMRTELTLSEGRTTLSEIDRDRWTDCSPAHIARMRQLTLDNRYIEEVGYFRDGRLACTSWGLVAKDVPQQTAPHSLPGGFGLQTGVKPIGSSAGTMLVLSRNDHNVLIKPDRLVDVLRDTQMSLGIAVEGGAPIAISGTADPALASTIARRAATGADDRHLFAAVRGSGLVAFAISERALLQDRIDRESRLLPLFAFAVSLILIAIIIWVSRHRLSPRKELAFAIRKRKLIAHYQPVIDLRTGQCVGAEALIRWRKPSKDRLPPDLLIPLAERTGLIDDITDLMIDCVATDLAQMIGAGLQTHVAINICPSDMESGRFLPVLHAALAREAVPLACVWLEATERGFLHSEAASKTIARARDAGHKVAIDDFGTGYSSLSMLEALPIDAIKIDKSFVDTIGKGSATSVVTPHVIEMAHGLDLNIVAEGVELPEQEAYLRDAGVEFAQGWLYARALPPEEFIAYCRSRNGDERLFPPVADPA